MLKRVNREIKELDINFIPISKMYLKENILSLEFEGPDETPFSKLKLTLKLSFPHDYPFRPPQIFFNPPIFHPNVTQDGFFNLYNRNWNPSFKIEHIFLNIYSLLYDPLYCNARDYNDKGKEEDDGKDDGKDYDSYSNEYAAKIWNDKNTVRNINLAIAFP